MKSLLFQEDGPFEQPSECALLPCREEVTINLRKGGRIYRFVLRDKIVPEDPYLVLVKAAAFERSLKRGAGRTETNRLKAAQADKAEQENRVRVGELIDRDEIVEVFSAALLAIRTGLPGVIAVPAVGSAIPAAPSHSSPNDGVITARAAPWIA